MRDAGIGRIDHAVAAQRVAAAGRERERWKRTATGNCRHASRTLERGSRRRRAG